MGIEVYEIGTHATIDGEIPGMITGICIRGMEHRASYEITWWDERTKKSDWFEAFEFTPKDAKTRTMTFKPSS